MAVTVDELLREPFSNRTRQQKVEIVLAGKPQPPLENLTSAEEKSSTAESMDTNESKFVIIFDKASYDHVEWLTGCDIRQALFCWPCLLFRAPHEDSWNQFGIRDLNNLGEKIKQHERRMLHIQSMLDLQLFASTLQTEQPAPSFEIKDNRNHDIAKRIIDVICYLIGQQKRPRIGSRDKNILEVEDCLENLHFLRDYDFLNTKLIDDGIEKIQKAPKIIGDMIEAITCTVKKTIQKELHNSTYVSVVLSEHSTERTKSQISSVVRYLRNGEVCERFLGFSHIEGLKSSKVIYELINKVIKDFQIYRKGIAYSFDGSMLASVPALYEVKQELKFSHPDIHFVPCYFHDLDDVLLRSLSFSAECDFFFKNVMAVGYYFQEGSSVCLKFDNFKYSEDSIATDLSSCGTFQPKVVKRCSNYAAFLNTIKTNRLSIIDLFDKSLRENENLTESDVIKLKALRVFLSNFKTVFLLETLLKLFDVVAPLVEAFKSPFPGLAFDKNLIECVLKSFDDELGNGVFDNFWWKIVLDFNELKTGDDRFPTSVYDKKKYACHKIYLEVTQCMKNQIKYRFEDTSKFSFCQILDLENSAKSLNSELVQTLISNYGQGFDYSLLDKEIKLVVVNKSAMNSESVHGLYKFFTTSGLGNSFTNLRKLCELVLTLPSTVPDTTRSVNNNTKLDEINLWFSSTGKQHSRDITFLCVEQQYVNELKRKKSFYDDVIDEFRTISKTLELQ